MGELREQMLSTGKKWQHEFFSVQDTEKKLITDVQKLSHKSSLWRNNTERNFWSMCNEVGDCAALN